MAAAGWFRLDRDAGAVDVVAFGRQTPTLLTRSAPGVVKQVPEGTRATWTSFAHTLARGRTFRSPSRMTSEGVQSFHGAGKIQASTTAGGHAGPAHAGLYPGARCTRSPSRCWSWPAVRASPPARFVLHPDVKRIVICDIERLVPTVVTPKFGVDNYHVVDGIAQQNPTRSMANRSR